MPLSNRPELIQWPNTLKCKCECDPCVYLCAKPNENDHNGIKIAFTEHFYSIEYWNIGNITDINNKIPLAFVSHVNCVAAIKYTSQ